MEPGIQRRGGAGEIAVIAFHEVGVEHANVLGLAHKCET